MVEITIEIIDPPILKLSLFNGQLKQARGVTLITFEFITTTITLTSFTIRKYVVFGVKFIYVRATTDHRSPAENTPQSMVFFDQFTSLRVF